jgi:hypothetical protein
MKTVTATLLGFLILALGASAQTATKAKKAAPTVSLDTILSCADDSYVQSVFKTDLATMNKLNIGLVQLAHYKDDADSKALESLSKRMGFWTGATDKPLELLVMPNPPVLPVPFCSNLAAHFLDDVASALPSYVEISVSDDYWTFNPNELFLHADQFTFRSGVFTDSTRVFFSATKGRVEIQSVAESKGLTLYRVFIRPPARN